MTYHLCGAKGVFETEKHEATEKRPTTGELHESFIERTPTRGSLLLLVELRAMPSCNREPSVTF